MEVRQSAHQQRVEQFMKLARQAVPEEPTLPDEATRALRARLILEEALETCEALGFRLADLEGYFLGPKQAVEYLLPDRRLTPSLEEVADGCADLSVVTIGTLSSCGVKDRPLLEEVDENNLAKFGPGHSWREDGKLIKPPGHKHPDIKKVIAEQMK